MSDIAGIAASSAQMSQQRVQEQAQVAVMKQSMEMDQQNSMQLLEGVTETSVATTGANPSENVGSSVDVKA